MNDPKEIKAEIMKLAKDITKLAMSLPKAYGSEGFHLTIDMIIHDGEVRGGIKAAPFNMKDGSVVYTDTDDDGSLPEDKHKNKEAPVPVDPTSPEEIVKATLDRLFGGH
jgi:hypothetical protein